MMNKMSKKVKITFVKGVEGYSCYINDNRVCGNKPWGGGKVIYESEADADKIMKLINK